ncbi:MAG: formylglycine-generating enzyme family protein [Bacteroidales bacterium]|nr:formylglycine-generating enzyme family protein [Bacteroidales bacterium]MCF8336403.1 formylglycine-generating enzyme family protein [Bacteroidales bacterium]
MKNVIFTMATIATLSIGMFATQSCSNSSDGTNDIQWINVGGGTFEMGCTDEQFDCKSDETPLHKVTLSSFEITKYEITNAQYTEFLNDINCNSEGSYNDDEYGNVEYITEDLENNAWSDCQIKYSEGQFVVESGKENHPVMSVSWYGANAFAKWAGGRLPREAEWEFAARGGNQSQNYIYSGSDNLNEVAWYYDNSDDRTHEVGQKQANEIGICDMSGNVMEWCHDWYGENYYSNSPKNNPQGPSSGDERVLRGGYTASDVNRCRVSKRERYSPGNTYNGEFGGFRIAR